MRALWASGWGHGGYYSKNQCPWKIHTIFNKAGGGMGMATHTFTAAELRIVWISHRHWFLPLSQELSHSKIHPFMHKFDEKYPKWTPTTAGRVYNMQTCKHTHWIKLVVNTHGSQ